MGVKEKKKKLENPISTINLFYFIDCWAQKMLEQQQ